MTTDTAETVGLSFSHLWVSFIYCFNPVIFGLWFSRCYFMMSKWRPRNHTGTVTARRSCLKSTWLACCLPRWAQETRDCLSVPLRDISCSLICFYGLFWPQEPSRNSYIPWNHVSEYVWAAFFLFLRRELFRSSWMTFSKPSSASLWTALHLLSNTSLIS